MGIAKRWSRIDCGNLANIPDEPGAYEIADRFKWTIDIVASEDFSERIPEKSVHTKFKGQAVYFRFIEDYEPWAAEAELQAEFMARYGRKPRFTYRLQGEAYDLLDDLLGW